MLQYHTHTHNTTHSLSWVDLVLITMAHNNFSATARHECLTYPEKVKSGSIVVAFPPNIYRQFAANGKSLEDVEEIGYPLQFGTIACLMYRHSENANSNEIWGVTVGHTFRPIKERHCRDKVLVSQICTPQKELCLAAQEYYATLDNLELEPHGSGELKFVDLAIFPLCRQIKEEKKYEMEIPQLRGMPDIFNGDDRSLQEDHGNVAKTGVITGYTEGKIITSNYAFTIDEMCPGIFAVIATEGYNTFASMGDSGSLVIDRHGGKVLGMVSAVYQGATRINGVLYRNVALCVRLDYCLRYAEQMWDVVLSFNNPTITLCETMPQVPVMTIRNRVNEIIHHLEQIAQEDDMNRQRTHAYIMQLQNEIHILRSRLQDNN